MKHLGRHVTTIATLCALSTASLTAVRAADFAMTAATTPAVDGAALFVGKEEGIFEKHGIDMTVTFMPILAYAPPALISNSIQTAAVPATVFLQAIEGGLDLVAISGATVTSKEIPNTGCLAGLQSGIKTPQDFIGKRVAVPGLYSVIHINFEEWLSEKGVDPGKVSFFEWASRRCPMR
jgi:NitT/TauT family transport system substrate-binding protein